MLVTILALSVCLSTVALFPVDIFLVSRIMDSSTGLRYDWATDEVIAQMQLWVKIVYYGKQPCFQLVLSIIDQGGGGIMVPPTQRAKRTLSPSPSCSCRWFETDSLHRLIVAYSLIASFCFFWIPLSYFYFEELDEEQTFIQRLWASFKYTIFFVLVACILLLTGLLMKPNRHEGIDLDWLRRVLADLGKKYMHDVTPLYARVAFTIDQQCDGCY